MDVVQAVANLATETVPACSALSVLEVELGMKDGEETATRSFLSAIERLSPTGTPLIWPISRYYL